MFHVLSTTATVSALPEISKVIVFPFTNILILSRKAHKLPVHPWVEEKVSNVRNHFSIVPIQTVESSSLLLEEMIKKAMAGLPHTLQIALVWSCNIGTASAVHLLDNSRYQMPMVCLDLLITSYIVDHYITSLEFLLSLLIYFISEKFKDLLIVVSFLW